MVVILWVEQNFQYSQHTVFSSVVGERHCNSLPLQQKSNNPDVSEVKVIRIIKLFGLFFLVQYLRHLGAKAFFIVHNGTTTCYIWINFHHKKKIWTFNLRQTEGWKCSALCSVVCL